MKLHELFLTEKIHTIQGFVSKLDQLKDSNGEYLTGTVNVTGTAALNNMKLEQLPVKFGTVGGSFYCDNNRLISLEGVPSIVGGNFTNCSNNRLTSLQGIHKLFKRINGTLFIRYNLFETGGIGLILVEGLTRIVADQPAFGIINQYLGQGNKGVLRCQEALHEAGYGEFAKL